MKLVTPVVGPRRALAVAVAAIISDRPLPSPAESLAPLSLAQYDGIVPHQIALLSSRGESIDLWLVPTHCASWTGTRTSNSSCSQSPIPSVFHRWISSCFFFPTWLCDNLCLPIRGEQNVLDQKQPSLSPPIDQIRTTNHI